MLSHRALRKFSIAELSRSLRNSSSIQELSVAMKEDILGEKFAKKMDSLDELKGFQSRFHIPKPASTSSLNTSIYFCGHSLGLQPVRTKQLIENDLNKWADQGVEGHFTEPNSWLSIDDTVQESLSKLVGANRSEVVAMNSLTTNLNLMMLATYRPTKDRHKIMIESKAFPSDIYAMKSQLVHHGYDPSTGLIEIAPREKQVCLSMDDVEAAIEQHKHQLSLVLMPGVQYFTGQVFDLKRLSAKCHEYGIVFAVDAAHAVGNVPLKLHDWNVDWAVWCHYKYMNSGAGAIGGCFMNSNLSSSLGGVRGWWGNNINKRFDMNGEFDQISGVYGYRLSNPPTIMIACLRSSLDEFDAVGFESRFRPKSILLTSYLETLLLKSIGSDHLTILTPPVDRGCQLSIRFKDNTVDAIARDLHRDGIFVDVRKPNVIRVAPSPFFNSYHQVFTFTNKLKQILIK